MDISKAARGRITGKFGAADVPGSHVKYHGGTDLGHGDMTEADLEIFAPADGVVTAVGWFGTYGNRLIIDHGRDAEARWETLIAHLSRIDVAVGDRVKRGQKIARMGSTGGNWPVHCHQELRRNGVQIDPALHFTTQEDPDMVLYTEQDKKDIQSARADSAAAKTAAEAAKAASERAVELLEALSLRSDNIQRGQDAQLRSDGVEKPEQAV